MGELSAICDRIEHKAAEVRGHATAQAWGRLTRIGFVQNLEKVVPGLEELYTLFQQARAQIARSGEPERPELDTHLREMNQLITVLRRNTEMEHHKIEKIRAGGVQGFAEAIAVPELYSELEQRTLSVLLKCSYAVERMRVFDRKKEPLMQAKAAQRNVLELLEQKEKELEQLRRRYEESRKNTFMGLVEKEGLIELENELNELFRSLEGKSVATKKLVEAARQSFTMLERQLLEIEERMRIHEETESQITQKTFEVLTALKKERDFAKKMLIEIEQETIQLRNTYSKELIGLQEEKMGFKNRLEEEMGKEAKELRHELRQRMEMIRHFQGTLEQKEKRIAELEEKNEKLRIISKTFEKHHIIKKHFLRGKKEKRKE